MILVKNWNFHLRLFLDKMGFEIMFAVIIQSKENKPSSTKKYRFDTVEILGFSKGLTHDFGQQLEIFCQFVFRQNEP